MDHSPQDPPPIACTLTGSEQAERTERWQAVLAGAPREDIAGGVRVRLPVGSLDEVTALVDAESRCCPFLTLRLTVSADGVVLDGHAPDGAEPLLRELLG